MIFVVSCIAVFIYAAYSLGTTVMDYYENRKVLNEVQETYYNVVSAEEQEELEDEDNEAKTLQPQFDPLLEENSDIVGWIKIDDTRIDYPIVQSDNNEEYLTKGFNKEDNIAGSIFMDYRNNIEKLDRNTVIYGHRMKDGTMFKDLTKFKNKKFFNEHKTFQIDTLYQSYEAEIFSFYTTTTEFNYIQTDFSSDEEFEQFLKQIEHNSYYYRDVNIEATDTIVTLSTCDYELDELEGRLVVHAKLKKLE